MKMFTITTDNGGVIRVSKKDIFAAVNWFNKIYGITHKIETIKEN